MLPPKPYAHAKVVYEVLSSDGELLGSSRKDNRKATLHMPAPVDCLLCMR